MQLAESFVEGGYRLRVCRPRTKGGAVVSDENTDGKSRPEDDPEFVDGVKALRDDAGVILHGGVEHVDASDKGAETGTQAPSRGCAAIVAVGVLVLLILMLFLASTKGVDPRRWFTSVEPAVTAPADTTGSAPQETDSSGTHDEEAADHVSQGWTPTQVDAGEWQVALAREDPLVETWSDIGGEPKEGNRAMLVDLYVTNNGAENRTIDKSFFLLKDSTGNEYAILGLEPQEAAPGSPVYVETWYEVPVDTQGLSLHFSPPASAGGEPVEIALPEIRY